MSTLGTEEGDHCREVLNKSQCMDFLSAGTKKSGCCREVAVVERWLLTCREVAVSRFYCSFSRKEEW